jgi:hypothetical protein
LVSRSDLENPDFNICHWYGNVNRIRKGWPPSESRFHSCLRIDDPVAFNAERALFSGRSYPGECSNLTFTTLHRFAVSKSVHDPNILDRGSLPRCYRTPDSSGMADGLHEASLPLPMHFTALTVVMKTVLCHIYSEKLAQVNPRLSIR